MSRGCESLIKGFLERDPKKRLGCGDEDVEEVKKQGWFSDLNWKDVYDKKIVPRYIPKVRNVLDTSNFSKEFTKESVKDTYVEGVILTPKDQFTNFTFQQKPTIG